MADITLTISVSLSEDTFT